MDNTSRDKSEAGFAQVSQFDRADQICDAYERALLRGERPQIEDYLGGAPEVERGALQRELELIENDYQDRQQGAKEPPGLDETLLPDGPVATPGSDELPSQIGRYQIQRLLGQGGFGKVYLAQDAQLQRLVAVKVPHAELVSHAGNPEVYLSEARTVANLDHPHIVPVYDIGATADCPCYVVSRYIDGCDLATKIQAERLEPDQAAELVATVAEALHYAHTRGVIHRDVKPGNVLIDAEGRPYVVDFGLALREETIGIGPKYVGTPAYMSPEQADGEGHRVDARSDIFSLGVVLYELLVGSRPFLGETQADLLAQLNRCEPQPLRQVKDGIPGELERICLKALAKRAKERYTSAQEVADDLRYFLESKTRPVADETPAGIGAESPERPSLGPGCVASQDALAAGAGTRTQSDQGQVLTIVPKGLRAFDSHDADFFLELLPGVRDREGLPDSLRFWKTRIEETDPDDTFPVGLIYGPSGCGKTSLVKAGLLPRLCDNVIQVYVEATPDGTEARLLRGLQKTCPAVKDLPSLKETLAALRRGQGISLGKKVLIVIDQFEQWLHAHLEEANTELVQALRQCDGGRVQCIVMVRDDFWMAVHRFMNELEFRLHDGQNSAAVDLFPIRHAEQVLAAFGRAFGSICGDAEQVSPAQRDFLSRAVTELAQDGKVNCVRLALFAEMMKGRDWTPAALKEVGGAKGVGARFLEETFSAATASRERAEHQPAARVVLAALLPESGSDIKGQMKSSAELQQACGHAYDGRQFEALIRILDSELRLITPTDRGTAEPDDASVAAQHEGHTYYQLTHDYLVHSLRDWLTRQQKETWTGRAELRLAERSLWWNDRPENRHLPSWREHASIRLFTQKNRWTQPQRTMMAKADRVHGIRTIFAAVLLALLFFTGLGLRHVTQQQRLRADRQVQENEYATRAEGLVQSLLNADISHVPLVVSDMQDVRPWTDPLLNAKIAEAADGSADKLRLALALLPVDESQVEYLFQQLSTSGQHEFPVVRDALLPHKTHLTDTLWRFASDEKQDPTPRFQTAAALAEYAPGDDRWDEIAPFVAQYLTGSALPVRAGLWLTYFQSASERVTDALADIHADRSRSEVQRETAALALADFLHHAPDRLAAAILVADEFAEFSPLITALRPHTVAVKQQLVAEMEAPLPDELAKTNSQLGSDQQEARDAHWKRRSLAAVTLVHLGYAENVWSLLRFTSDPSLRSFIIHYLGKLQADHNMLAARLESETDVSIRRALIQSIGGLDSTRVPTADRERICLQLQALYQHDPDPGIHGSALWMLRQWAAALPDLPVGEPILTEQQQREFAEAESNAEEFQRRTAMMEKELASRQTAWEIELQYQTTVLPTSLCDGLVAHFPLDELEGIETINAVEGQPGGIYQGPGQPVWVKGVVGNALRLDGRGGHMNCGQAFSPERTDAFSYGCWLFSENSWYATVLAKMDAEHGYRGFDLFLDNSNRIAAHVKHRWPDNFLKMMAVAPLSTRQWHHVVMTYEGSSNAAGATIYVDGQAVGATVVVDRLSATIQNGRPVCIGTRSGDQPYPFRGEIDDVRIYNRCLAAAEVAQIFEFGISALARVPAENRRPGQQAALAARYRLLDEPFQRLESQLATEVQRQKSPWEGARRWYINSQGQTMIVIGRPVHSGDGPINHDFAISNHEATVAEFRRFNEQHQIDPMLAPTDRCPVYGTSWYVAAEYCNWLSKQDGIPEVQWVYEPNAGGKYAAGMKIKEDFLQRLGYRLPTEAEWEIACRAGTKGTFGFGEPVSLLASYGRYVKNSTGRGHAVESLLPNEFGIFDMHGNLWEWQQNASSGPLSPVDSNRNRALRGGTFYHPAWYVRSGERDNYQPSYRKYTYGFRPARTCRLSSATPVARTAGT